MSFRTNFFNSEGSFQLVNRGHHIRTVLPQGLKFTKDENYFHSRGNETKSDFNIFKKERFYKVTCAKLKHVMDIHKYAITPAHKKEGKDIHSRKPFCQLSKWLFSFFLILFCCHFFFFYSISGANMMRKVAEKSYQFDTIFLISSPLSLVKKITFKKKILDPHCGCES